QAGSAPARRAGDDRLVQGPRRGPPPRPRRRRQLLPDQERLPRRGAAPRRARSDRGAVVRIAIANDSPLAVEALRRVLVKAGHAIAWVAGDGGEAAAACARDVPDLLLMDLRMPVMDGVACTRRIMAESPCAILVVTAGVDANFAAVYEAMGAGALDA